MNDSRRQAHNFSGKVALIMGASQGIGKATAQVLAAYGATVILCSRCADAIEEAALQICDAGGEAHGQVCDVTDFSAIVATVGDVIEKFGAIDLLVNNAGVIDPLAHILDSDPDAWSLAVDINLKGVYNAMRAVAPIMVERGEGTIINMSSGAANSALVGWSHYCGTKAAAKKLTEVGHKELSDTGVRIVGLSPGTVATDMMRKIRDSQINVVSNLDWSSHIQPEWVGEAVAYLFGSGGDDHLGGDFSIKTPEGRRLVGLPAEGAPDA